MKFGFLRKILLPPGPILSLTLIGLLLLSAVLYYKAVRFQRFMEPALAISHPRAEFIEKIRNLIADEFGLGQPAAVRFAMDSILVDGSLVATELLREKKSESVFFKKLSGLFLSILRESELRPHVDLILVITRLPVTAHRETDNTRGVDMEHRAESVLASLYASAPELKQIYGDYFAAVTAAAYGNETMRVEFRFIQGEHLHIEFLQRLQKYVY